MSFQKGMGEAITGIVGSIIFSAILSSFAEDGLIPSNMVFLISFVGFLGTIILISSFRTAGIFFLIGWIIGAILLKDMLSTLNFFVYLVAPILVSVIRFATFFKRN